MIAARTGSGYAEITEIFAGGDVQAEVIKVWSTEADEWVYEAVGTVTGTLPLTAHADGDTVDYKIYGDSGGVGDRTVNIFSYDMIDITTEGTYINTSGNISYASGWYITEYIPASGDYATIYGVIGSAAVIAAYDSNKTLLRVTRYANTLEPRTINLLNAAYVRFSIYPTDQTEVMLVYGTAAPASYIPYGYKLDMVSSDGTTDITTPIYIGDEPLYEDEYVDFGEQKVYRYVGGVLAPTDPPVPLPALPTFADADTVFDYDETPAPSGAEITFKKGW